MTFKIGGLVMVPMPLYNMAQLINESQLLSKVELPKNLREKNRLFSKGTLNMFKGENLDKFVQMTVKGFNIYYYDFGIAYPAKSIIYPVFLYQIISAPKRVLVVVNYAFPKNHEIGKIKGFDGLLDQDAVYSEMLIKAFEPQEFLKEDLISNRFNGLVRTTEIDKAHEKILDLFKYWYQGMALNSDLKLEGGASYHDWLNNFKDKFYREDYGFTASKKFLGEKWSKEVFENYLFD